MPTTTDALSYQGKEDQLLSKQQFGLLRNPNQLLITVFQHCIINIKEHLSGTYLFLLTNKEGVLLAMDYSLNLEHTVDSSPIHIGMSTQPL